MNPPQLERREQALDREIKQWEAGATHRKGLITKLETQIEVLAPKVEVLQGQVKAAQDELARLSTKEKGFLESVARAKHELHKLEGQSEALADTKRELEDTITAIKSGKQAEIDVAEAEAWALANQG